MTLVRGRGRRGAAARSLAIARTYGFREARILGQTWSLASALLERGVRPTLPVTASVLARRPEPFRELAAAGAEIAIHGLHHVDHLTLSPDQQTAALRVAHAAFLRAGLAPAGYRAPYLRANEATVAAVAAVGLLYDASPAVAHPISGGNQAGYGAVVDFQLGRPVADVPALPWLEHDVVRLPYSLPDDEALDRLALPDPTAAWREMLIATHHRGELLCVGVHPERAARYAAVLSGLLDELSRLGGGVWVASLAELAAWWRTRAAARMAIAATAGGYRVTLTASTGVGLELRWPDGRIESVGGWSRLVESTVRPSLGVPATVAPALVDTLSDLGYIVERSDSPSEHGGWVDPAHWSGTLDRVLLGATAPTRGPLAVVGRWPDGARSALNVSGDVDALSLVDFARRLVGR